LNRTLAPGAGLGQRVASRAGDRSGLQRFSDEGWLVLGFIRNDLDLSGRAKSDVSAMPICICSSAPAAAVTANGVVLVEAIPGDGCDGVLGTVAGGPLFAGTKDASAMVARVDFADDRSFVFDTGPNDEGEPETTGTGSWTSTPDPGDPGIAGCTIKRGPSFGVGRKTGPAVAGVGDVGDTWSSPRGGISHIPFFDGAARGPLPAGAWLSLAGLGAPGTVTGRPRSG